MNKTKTQSGNLKNIKVPLEVLIGKCELTLAEFAEIGEGTIIQLDKMAGEPVDLVAAGEFVAKGEVVVIDENFGIRVTEIYEKTEN